MGIMGIMEFMARDRGFFRLFEGLSRWCLVDVMAVAWCERDK